MSKEDKAYIVQLVKQIVHPYFAGEIADILIAHGMTFKTEPQTKGDRIRAMSDEELAVFINKIVVNHHVKIADNCNHCPLKDARPCDTEGIVDWLKQLAEPPKEETT